MEVTRTPSVLRGALLVFAVIAGVLGMHGLPAHGMLPGPSAAGHDAMGMAHGEHQRSGEQPDKRHERGPACEAAGIGGPVHSHAAADAVAWPFIRNPQPTPQRFAAPSGWGGGRGPPSLTELCVSRI